MIVRFNEDLTNGIKVESLSRELLSLENGSREFNLRLTIDDSFADTLQYLDSLVDVPIKTVDVYNDIGEELINSYPINGKLNSIHEVLDSTIREVSVIIRY